MGADALRRQRGGDDDALGLDLGDPLCDQLGNDGCVVDLLHLARGRLLGQLGDPLELLLGVLVAREDALEVEDRETAELADQAGRVRRDDAVHRRGKQREVEAIVAELPRDVDVVGVSRAPGRHDRDVVEAVCTAGLLPSADLNLHWRILGVGADKTTPSKRGREQRDPLFAGAGKSSFELSSGLCTPVAARRRGLARDATAPLAAGTRLVASFSRRTRSRPVRRPRSRRDARARARARRRRASM